MGTLRNTYELKNGKTKREIQELKRMTDEEKLLIRNAVSKASSKVYWKSFISSLLKGNYDKYDVLEKLSTHKNNLIDIIDGNCSVRLAREINTQKNKYIFHIINKCTKDFFMSYRLFPTYKIDILCTIVIEHDEFKNIINVHYNIKERRLQHGPRYDLTVFNPLFIPFLISRYVNNIHNGTKVVFKKESIRLNIHKDGLKNSNIDFKIAPLRNKFEGLAASVFTKELINNNLYDVYNIGKLCGFNGDFDGDSKYMSMHPSEMYPKTIILKGLDADYDGNVGKPKKLIHRVIYRILDISTIYVEDIIPTIIHKIKGDKNDKKNI